MVEYIYDHLHFVCGDAEVTAKFLVENFGAVEFGRSTFGPIVLIRVRLGDQVFLLHTPGPNDQIEGDMGKRRHGLDHWGIVVNDLDAAYEDLQAKGIEFLVPPTSVGASRYAYIVSPDNVRIEIVERK